MLKRIVSFFFAVGLLLLAHPTSAHPLDVAYLDFGITTSSTLTLTAAIHPYQAFELVRAGSSARFDLKRLAENGELISAYIEDHVSVKRGEHVCRWNAASAFVPQTELDAVADGITVAGALTCDGSSPSLQVSSSMFLEGFPNQTSILRLETPDGYAERLVLNRETFTGDLDLSPILPGGKWAMVTSTASVEQSAPRRPDAAILEIAGRLLDPGLSWWGFMGLLLAAAAVGMLHALGPGHGKSLLAAVLIGERATVGRAIGLASVMAVTHVADVFLMALLAGVIASFLPPTTLLLWLEGVSAASLLVLGLVALVRAVRRYREVQHHPSVAMQDDEAHARMHALGISHVHGVSPNLPIKPSSIPQSSDAFLRSPQSVPDPLSLVRTLPLVSAPESVHLASEDARTFRQSLWMGFVGSLAPCPTAWAMFMATLSLGRLGAGVLLLISFSIGLYATVVGIGLLLVVSKTFALRKTPPQITYFLPILSGCIISFLGAWMLLRVL